MTADAAASSPDVDLRDLIDGTVLLASTANLVMQLARPAIGYGVLESKVESGQTMRCPFRRIRNTVTYMSVAMMGTEAERAYLRRQVTARMRWSAPARTARSATAPSTHGFSCGWPRACTGAAWTSHPAARTGR